MSHKCTISGISRQVGNRVSHAKNRKKHVFQANIQTKKIFIPSLNRAVKIKLSTRMLRTIDKLGIEKTLDLHGISVQSLLK